MFKFSILTSLAAGEGATVVLYEIMPMAADTTTTPSGSDAIMAELVVSLPDPNTRGSVPVELQAFNLPFNRDTYVMCAEPGQDIEIEGVNVQPCYPLGLLDVPAVGSSDALYLPWLVNGNLVYDLMKQNSDRWLAPTLPGFVRRVVSVINRDNTGTETNRVNLFQSWPSSFSFFDPTQPYGYQYLFSVTFVNDWVEAA